MSTTHDWPIADLDLELERFEPGWDLAVPTVESPYTGATSYGEIPFASRRTLTIAWPSHLWAVRQKVLGFLLKIRRPNFVRIPMLTAPAPRGTLRGSPTVTGTAVRGSTSISITPSANGTLLMGDHIGVTTDAGPQVVTITADVTLTGATLVGFEPPLRGQVAAGSAVVWDKPPVVYVLVTDWKAPYRGSEGEPLAVDLREHWSA